MTKPDVNVGTVGHIGHRRKSLTIPLLVGLATSLSIEAERPMFGTNRGSNPLKLCQCGKGYDHSGWQCKECYDRRNKNELTK